MAWTLELDGVSKRYGEFVAVDKLSLHIAAGELLGLLGPNGAGKTSSIRMMIGITAPDCGQVRLFGRPLERRALAQVGYLPEERGLYRRMKLREHLIFLGQLKGLSAAEARRRSMRWLERIGMAARANARVEELSKGMQQKAQFVAALLHEPSLLIFDEPFSGLDPASALALKDVLLELKQQGCSILLSTHRMDTVERLCDAICLLDRSRCVLAGGVAEIRTRYGHRSVQMEYDGTLDLLADRTLVEHANNFGNYVELRLAAGADPQQLLQRAAQQVRIRRFALVEPSIEEIFIETVGGPKKTDEDA